jgi:hypothetical protein
MVFGWFSASKYRNLSLKINIKKDNRKMYLQLPWSAKTDDGNILILKPISEEKKGNMVLHFLRAGRRVLTIQIKMFLIFRFSGRPPIFKDPTSIGRNPLGRNPLGRKMYLAETPLGRITH